MARFLVSVLLLVGLLLALPGPESEAGKLAEDGRSAVVREVQGSALVRPAGRTRWTPLGPKSLLFPGDLVRTSPRGAHALEMSSGGGVVLLGPGTLVELGAPGHVRLLQGALEAVGSEKAPLTLTGPGDFRQETRGTSWLLVGDGAARTLSEAPRWVTSYRASASDEWMGSLLAQVDGRNVPLAVGYHKVDVEVRDQVARTTVEQSFVNSTDSRLEGVFYFPLPADASISGFGMWIGGELVEADIVERARARQIYEDILRRKKDPGLLEWEGGNLFKARVFPIEARSEKRIRIRYTQVLPKQGDTWRYRYALRSELLRSKPLRELKLTVRVVSTDPIQELSSPTHDVLTNQTKHEATAEFLATEYSPDKDFELAVRLAPAGALTAIPHRRGEDGYFMLLLSPPDEAAEGWTRDLAPEGAALDVILLADTSGSQDEGARANQAAFIDAFLSLLGEQDRFRLAACDVQADWLVPEATAPDPDAVEEALARLAARPSLGWTDLEQGLDAALAAATPESLVVYIGDGVGTTGDADPIALAERLRARASTTSAHVHAVAPSSSYETPVLEALSRIGPGSLRIVGSQPTGAAFALLAEAQRPVLRDAEVRIEGLRTARVYPAALPNVTAGTQQIVLGRFLPTAAPQSGTVIVTGMLAGKPVRYSAPLTIGTEDAGNSFLPRLWARRHIESLLQQGASSEIREEIVDFSERFGVMTPYTSFLVLESDEDRERYGVERRVRMRDGERFFADARDKAELERRRDLIRDAGRWRLGMRQAALREIARLGRDLPIPSAQEVEPELEKATAWSDAHLGFGGPPSGGMDRGLAMTPMLDEEVEELEEQGGWGAGGLRAEARSMGRSNLDAGRPGAPPMAPTASAAPEQARRSRKSADKSDVDPEDASLQGGAAEESLALEDMDVEDMGELVADARGGGAGGRMAGKKLSALGSPSQGYFGRTPQPPERSGFTLARLGFPIVPPAPEAEADAPPETPGWSDEVRTLLLALPRRDVVEGAGAGLHLVLLQQQLHPTRQRVQMAATWEAWLASGTWQIARHDEGFGEPSLVWVDEKTRGILARARKLVRTRDVKPEDARAWQLPLWDLQGPSALEAWRTQGYTQGRMLPNTEEGLVVVELSTPPPHVRRVLLHIDPARRLLVREQRFHADGRNAESVQRSDFMEVAGRWWARTAEGFDAEGRRVARQTLELEAMSPADAEAYPAARARELESALRLHGPLPTTAEAKQALASRTARLEDHFALLLDLGQAQRWPAALARWKAMAPARGERFASAWIEAVLLSEARQGEAYAAHLQALLALAANAPAPARRFLSAWTLAAAQGRLAGNELGALWDQARALYVDPEAPGREPRRLSWLRGRTRAFDQAGLSAEARALRAETATLYPLDDDAQLAYENDLWVRGERTEARLLLERLLEERQPWLDSEENNLYGRLSDRLWSLRQIPRLRDTCARWVAACPEEREPYLRLCSSLYFAGATEEADALLQGWLAASLKGPWSARTEAARQAAVGVTLGSGWNFYANRLDTRWREPLADLCLRELRSDRSEAPNAAQIYNHWRFRQTDEWRRLQATLQADIRTPEAVATWPLARLVRVLQLLPWSRGQVSDEDVQRILADMAKRWEEAAAEPTQDVIAQERLRILDARGAREEAISFAERRLARASAGARRAALAADLFRRLLSTPARDAALTDERIARLFVLLPETLDPSAAPEARSAGAAQMTRTLVAALDSWRFEALWGTPEARAELTRAELTLRKREARTGVRRDLATRLSAAARSATGATQPWLHVEALAYAIERGEATSITLREARQVLGADWKREARPLDRLLRERAAVILAYAAARKDATPKTVTTVLATFERGDEAWQALHAEDADATALLDWRAQIVRVLLARDDLPTLLRTLDQWILPGAVESRWRVARAYLHAEAGQLEPAISELQTVAAVDELDGSGYRQLAEWLLVTDRDADRRKALDQSYEHMGEYDLSSEVSRLEGSSRRGGPGMPDDAEAELYPALRALMRKAPQPAQHWYRIRNLYRQQKDHRALGSMADAVTGHTKEATYAFLAQVSQLLADVHEEATCDELAGALQARLQEAQRPLDRRALLLLLARVSARAAEVKQKDAAHEEAALAALQAALQEEWQPHERRLMAAWLQSLGPLSGAAGTEQRRQFEALRTGEAAGSVDRLWISYHFAGILWAAKEQDAAVEALRGAIDEIRSMHDSRLPAAARPALDTLVNWLASQAHFADAERLLLEEGERRETAPERRPLRLRLYALYADALKRGGSVSIGRGAGLFETARTLMEADTLMYPAEAGVVLSRLVQLYEGARVSKQVEDPGAQLARYARERLPELLLRVPLNASNNTNVIAAGLMKLQGPLAGLSLLLDRTAAEPDWLERIDQDMWNQSSYNIARWRAEGGALGALEKPLEKLVVRQIERNLIELGDRYAPIWRYNQKWFWREKAHVFADTADRVAELHEDDPALVYHCATFLRTSLGEKRRAVALLQAADARSTLAEGMRWTLCAWLLGDKAFGAALPLCQALSDLRPDQVRYRLGVARALAGLDRNADALGVLQKAETHLRKRELWGENTAAQFGTLSLQLQANEEGERWLEEAVTRRQEARGHRGGQDRTLGRYYQSLALARARLGKTRAAVEAASSAILSANPRNQRDMGEALQSLDAALAAAQDLPAFLATYDQEVDTTGLDAPVIRKALARVLAARGDDAGAAAQLLLARDLAPEDGQIHTALVAAYDRLEKPDQAIAALFGSIRLAPHNLAAYGDLAARYQKAGEEAAAERARTTLVEPAPNQADGHRRLAILRQEQGHWKAAVLQWQQVVRTEPLDPMGLLSLARALLQAGDKAAATAALEQVIAGTWEERHGDPKGQAAELLRGLK